MLAYKRHFRIQRTYCRNYRNCRKSSAADSGEFDRRHD